MSALLILLLPAVAFAGGGLIARTLIVFERQHHPKTVEATSAVPMAIDDVTDLDAEFEYVVFEESSELSPAER